MVQTVKDLASCSSGAHSLSVAFTVLSVFFHTINGRTCSQKKGSANPFREKNAELKTELFHNTKSHKGLLDLRVLYNQNIFTPFVIFLKEMFSRF